MHVYGLDRGFCVAAEFLYGECAYAPDQGKAPASEFVVCKRDDRRERAKPGNGLCSRTAAGQAYDGGGTRHLCGMACGVADCVVR